MASRSWSDPKLTFVDAFHGIEITLSTNPRNETEDFDPDLPPFFNCEAVRGRVRNTRLTTTTTWQVGFTQYYRYTCPRSNFAGSHPLAHLYYGSLVARFYDLSEFVLDGARYSVRGLNIGTWEELQRRIHGTTLGSGTETNEAGDNGDSGSDSSGRSAFDLENLLNALRESINDQAVAASDLSAAGNISQQVLAQLIEALDDRPVQRHERVKSDTTWKHNIFWAGWGPNFREHQRTHQRSTSESTVLERVP